MYRDWEKIKIAKKLEKLFKEYKESEGFEETFESILNNNLHLYDFNSSNKFRLFAKIMLLCDLFYIVLDDPYNFNDCWQFLYFLSWRIKELNEDDEGYYHRVILISKSSFYH